MTIYREGLLRDQVVAITGGGTGLGLTIAREAAALGAKLAICGRRAEVIEEARRDLEASGHECFGAACDIREPAQNEAFVDGALARFGRIDVLVNNAGGQFPSPARSITPKGFEAVVRNNLCGTWNMTQAVATRAMLPRQSGVIVNITAQVARGFPGMMHTGAARAGVENMTKSLAVEWAMHGIRVNAVAPGVLRTSGTARYPEELLEMARKATPMKRVGSAEEVSHLVVYLMSPAAAFVTGQTYLIDGGASLWGDVFQIPD